MHSSKNYNVTSSNLTAHLTALAEAQSRRLAGRLASAVLGRGRALQAKDDGVAKTAWGCDDLRFHCSPVCLRTRGVVTTQVPGSQCAGPKPQECACAGCYHDAHWACGAEGGVVCRATRYGQEAVVGALVCETRGSKKPARADFEFEGGECVKQPTARGNAPPPQCVAEPAAVAPLDPASAALDGFDVLSGSVAAFAAAAVVGAVL